MPDNTHPRKEKGKKKFQLSIGTLITGGVILGVILVGALFYWQHARNFQSTDDAYTTAHVHPISARVTGTVESVKVDDNQLVKEGDPLIVLDQREFKMAVEQARAQISQRRAASVQAKTNLNQPKPDESVTKPGAGQMLPKPELAKANAASKGANAATTGAAGDMAAAETALKSAELQLSYTTIKAPADGIIAKKTVETGARVQPGQALMAVVEPNIWVLANFKETQLARMHVGQHVDVKIDAIPGHQFSAHIDSLQAGTGATFALLPPDNATGNFTKIVQRVPVKIVFDDLGEYGQRVRPGLSCEARIDLRTGPRQ
jgi:membrane fusion protein (multidrug efflux system)